MTLEKSGIPAKLIDLCFNLTTGDFDTFLSYGSQIGYQTEEAAKYRQTHPPFLTPLLIDRDMSPVTLCYAKHWFTQRDTTFVKRFYQDTTTTIEIATGIDQLIGYYAILNGGMYDLDELSRFCQSWNFPYEKEVYDFVNVYGDNVSEAYRLSFWKDNPALNSVPVPDLYRGSAFANKYFNIPKNVVSICSYELIDVSNLKDLTSQHSVTAPSWLYTDKSKSQLFEEYFDNNLLDKAWLTLNSNGWKASDAARALQLLRTRNTDAAFHEMVDNWIEVNDNPTYSY